MMEPCMHINDYCLNLVAQRRSRNFAIADSSVARFRTNPRLYGICLWLSERDQDGVNRLALIEITPDLRSPEALDPEGLVRRWVHRTVRIRDSRQPLDCPEQLLRETEPTEEDRYYRDEWRRIGPLSDWARQQDERLRLAP